MNSKQLENLRNVFWLKTTNGRIEFSVFKKSGLQSSNFNFKFLSLTFHDHIIFCPKIDAVCFSPKP